MYKTKRDENVIRDTVRRWKCGVACSFGQDSMTLLHLIRQQGETLPVLFEDTHIKLGQTYDSAERMMERWNLNLYRTVSPACDRTTWEQDEAQCCHRLNVELINELASEPGLDADFVAIRRDEHPARSKASSFDRIGGATHVDRIDFDHHRVRPLSDWSETDVWTYIQADNLPYSPLYDDDCRSIGCESHTHPSTEMEKNGREQDEELVLDRLRRLGCF